MQMERMISVVQVVHSQVDYLYRVLRKNQLVPCTEARTCCAYPVGFCWTDSNVIVPPKSWNS